MHSLCSVGLHNKHATSADAAQCWASVKHDGSTLHQHRPNAPRLLCNFLEASPALKQYSYKTCLPDWWGKCRPQEGGTTLITAHGANSNQGPSVDLFLVHSPQCWPSIKATLVQCRPKLVVCMKWSVNMIHWGVVGQTSWIVNQP